MPCRYMWPPVNSSEPRDTRAVNTDFPSWIEQNDGALTGLLVVLDRRRPSISTQFSPQSKGMRSQMRCKDALPQARALLASFDLVSVTSCMPQLLDSLAHHMRLPPDSVEQQIARRSSVKRGKLVPFHVRPVTTFPRQTAYVMSRRWTWETLNISSRLRLWQLTRCDNELYLDAKRLANHTLSTTCMPAEPIFNLTPSIALTGNQLLLS